MIVAMMLLLVLLPSTAAFQSRLPPSLPSTPSTKCNLSQRRGRCLFAPVKHDGPNGTFDWSRSYASKKSDNQAAVAGTDDQNVPKLLSIHSLLEAGRLDDAVLVLKDRSDTDEEGKVPASTYHAVIEACCSGGFEPKKRNQRPMKNNNNHAAKAKDVDRIEKAAELLQAMEEEDVVTAHAHEIIISGYARRGRWKDASRLLSSMEETLLSSSSSSSQQNGASPNVYQTVLTSLAKAHQFQQMNSLLTKMRRGGVRPNTYTYNSLLKICASDKIPRWKEALSLLSQCQREPGVDPDLITYTTAMKACARGRQAGKAMELFRAAKDMGMQLDVYCYTTAMDACAKGGGKRWRKALSLLDEMKGEGIEPNEVTYGVAVTACGNGGQWERALELLDQMREMNLRINTITYNSAIAALSKAGRTESKQHTGETDTNVLWQKALDLIKRMEVEGVRRDVFTFSSAISTCGAAGRWEEAVDLIEEMKADGTKPNKVAYTAAITACANSRQWDPAFALFNQMKNDGLRPDIVAHNALIGAGMTANKPLEVFNLWQEMCQPNDEKVSPDIVTLTEVIATLDSASGKPNRERVDEVFADAVTRGLILRKDSLDTSWEVDLSNMAFPVARAACRYIFKQIADRKLVSAKAGGDGDDVKDLSLITGPSRMREYIRGVLRDELKPSIYCVVPKLEQGTLQVKEKMLRNYFDGQI